MSKLRIAVVGCGLVADSRHIPSFLRLQNEIDLCAVCDIKRDFAVNVAKKFGIPKVYSNLSDMLSKEALDIVDVCTPPRVHASVAIESMEHGCHVLLEKPMALSVSDCDNMIDATRKTRQKLNIVHNQIFYPPFLKARELVSRGEIGKLTGMSISQLTNRTDYMNQRNHWIHSLPGGVLGETGPHVVYMSLAFLRKVRNVEVCARKTLEYPWVLYDDYRIELEGKDMTSSIVISHANDYAAADVALFGREGMIRMDLQSMLLMHYKRENLTPISVALSSLKVAGQIIKGVMSNALNFMLRRPLLGHDIMIEKFVNSIINDQPVPVTPEEGRETVRVMEMLVDKLDRKYGVRTNK